LIIVFLENPYFFCFKTEYSKSTYIYNRMIQFRKYVSSRTNLARILKICNFSMKLDYYEVCQVSVVVGEILCIRHCQSLYL